MSSTATTTARLPAAAPVWTLVGYEGEEERWIDRHGRSVDALARYRWHAYQQNDFDDYETVEAVDADMDRQRAERAERG